MKPLKVIPRDRLENLISRPEFPETRPQPTPLGVGRLVMQRERAISDDTRKSQDQWIEHYKSQEEWRFPSSAEHYQVFKQLQAEPDQELLNDIRTDWNSYWTVASTRITYQPDKLDSTITHNFGDEQNQRKVSLEIPEYLGVYLNQIDQSECEPMLQALFGTQDRLDNIVEVLEYVSDKPASKIKLWTPPLENDGYTTRAERPERSVFFDYYDDGFLVDCYYRPGDDDGFSRGVKDAV